MDGDSVDVKVNRNDVKNGFLNKIRYVDVSVTLSFVYKK